MFGVGCGRSNGEQGLAIITTEHTGVAILAGAYPINNFATFGNQHDLVRLGISDPNLAQLIEANPIGAYAL